MTANYNSRPMKFLFLRARLETRRRFVKVASTFFPKAPTGPRFAEKLSKSGIAGSSDLLWHACQTSFQTGSNVFNARYFLYSENNHQEGTVDDPQNKECKKITKKLDGNFFLVTSTNCGL